MKNLFTATYWIASIFLIALIVVSLGYSFPERWINKIRLKTLSVYVSADNLVTWTNYSGLDPEVNISGTSATAMSIDQGVVPHPRTYVFGVNVVF